MSNPGGTNFTSKSVRIVRTRDGFTFEQLVLQWPVTSVGHEESPWTQEFGKATRRMEQSEQGDNDSNNHLRIEYGY